MLRRNIWLWLNVVMMTLWIVSPGCGAVMLMMAQRSLTQLFLWILSGSDSFILFSLSVLSLYLMWIIPIKGNGDFKEWVEGGDMTALLSSPKWRSWGGITSSNVGPWLSYILHRFHLISPVFCEGDIPFQPWNSGPHNWGHAYPDSVDQQNIDYSIAHAGGRQAWPSGQKNNICLCGALQIINWRMMMMMGVQKVQDLKPILQQN